MREREIFQKVRKRRIAFSLRNRMTLLVGGTVIVSFFMAFGLILFLQWLFPPFADIPSIVQMPTFSLIVALIVARLFSRLFFDPIKKLREGMKQVADGDFSVRLESKSNSVEIQELIAGFNLMAKELGSIEMLQTDFVSNVSHEFKTPINAIEGYTTLLQGDEHLEKEQREYVDKILFNTHRLSSLVSNILFLSKIENLDIQTNQKHYRLDEQIRESIVALETAWEPKNIDFDVDLEQIDYYGNESIMYHVWNNLIGNAIKFSPEGGEISISLQKMPECYLFIIEDQGPGIPEDMMKRIYDKFFQGDTSHKAEGNGLGLALVKGIIELVGGQILAENVETGGCRFMVSLPRC